MKRTLICIMTTLVCGANAYAQPGDRPHPPMNPEARESREARDGREPGSESIRDRLEISIERGEEQLARNRAALERLNNGESPASILRAMRTDSPRGRQGEANRPDQPPRDDRARTEPTEERLNEIKAFVHEHIPELEQKLGSITEQNGPVADRLMMRLAPMIDEVMRAFREDPSFGRLKLDELRSGLGFVEAMRVYRAETGSPSATDEDRAAAIERLRHAAEARFDAQMKIREYEITKLTEQLLAMSSTLSEMRESRDGQIEQMISATRAGNNPHRPQRRDQDRDQDRAAGEKESGDD